MIPLLSAAQDESREELTDIYAKLLAAAADPKRKGTFRREFIEVAKQLDPLDALVLDKLQEFGPTSCDPNKVAFFAIQLQVPADHIANSFSALKRLGLTDQLPGSSAQIFPLLSAFGRQFLAAIAN
jgi:hypothetical protein